MKSSRDPYAVVIGLDSINGIQTARLLKSRGVPVIAVAQEPAHFGCRTRACERVLFADTGSAEFIATLEALGPTLEQKAVLFPCADMPVLFVSRHRKSLEPWFHVVLPDADVVELLMDKVRFYTYAQEAGLPIPRTRFLRTRVDVEEAMEELRFPCILKPPMKTPDWLRHAAAGVYRVPDPSELSSLYDQCAPWAELLMVQEWIEGSDRDLYSCNCYLDADSRPLATFVARKLRQWPPRAGTSSLGEECRNDEVLHESVRLLQGVGYRGMAYVEMKREARTGAHFIIEPNVGRPTGRSALAEACGVELLCTQYCDALGRPLPAQREQRYEGVKWIHFRRDMQAALYDWWSGELTLREWWRSWRGRKVYAVFSWTDPLPFLGDLFSFLRRLPGKIRLANAAAAIRRRVGYENKV
jgi:predicted ATP-grasp superfamily ATP-dependent carboligase